MGGSAKGYRAENELFHLLHDNGFAVARVAGSGSTTKPAPDLLAGGHEQTLAVECKSSSGDTIYVNRREAEELKEFSDKFGATPLIGVRFNHIDWKFFPLESLETAGKSYKITRKMAERTDLTIENLH